MAFNLNSKQHKVEFHNSKSNLLSFLSMWCLASLRHVVAITHAFVVVYASNVWIHWFCKLAVQIVWHHDERLLNARHQSIYATCLHVLPLVEMFCNWEFQEDCSDLKAVMLRYDSESELGLMCSDNRFCPCFGMMTEASNTNLETLTSHEVIDPFREIRERLANVDATFGALVVQVVASHPSSPMFW